MNIFATGMNPADANALKRAPRVALFQAFVEMMNQMKANKENVVCWRRHRVGDPLPPDTHAVIVSSMLPRSLNCPYALGVVWAMAQALEQKIPLVIYLTDWAFFKATGEFKSIAKQGQSYFSKEIGGSLQYNESPEAIERHGEALLDICQQYATDGSNLWKHSQILVPRYTNWGDVSIVQRLLPAGANPVFTMDPTPLFVRYLEQPEIRTPIWGMEDREKRWILPSLLKDDRWLVNQNLRWPVERYGPKGFYVLPTERDIHAEYRRSVGALCPPYPTVGSGWWRSRWIHSAKARSILLCDPVDAKRAGIAYLLNGRQIETLDNVQLRIVAEGQRERMEQLFQTDMGVFFDQMYAPFRAAGVA